MRNNNIEQFKFEGAFYKHLENTVALKWLSRHYKDSDPLWHYQELRKILTKFQITKYLVVLSMWLGWGFCAVTLSREKVFTYDDLNILIPVFSILVPVFLVSRLCKTWNELIDAWIKAKWETCDFRVDVRSLAITLFPDRSWGTINLNDLNQCFSSYAHQILVGIVPYRLMEKSDEFLVVEAKKIKMLEKENWVNDPLIKTRKDALRYEFELFRCFSLLPPDVDIRFYYGRATRQLAREEAVRQQNRGSI